MALRFMALSGLQAAETQTGRCSCGKVTHPTHFLSCSWNRDLRTFRHHAIRKTLTKCLAEVTLESQASTKTYNWWPSSPIL